MIRRRQVFDEVHFKRTNLVRQLVWVVNDAHRVEHVKQDCDVKITQIQNYLQIKKFTIF